MRNSLKLGLVLAVGGSIAAFAGCSSDSTTPSDNGGSSGTVSSSGSGGNAGAATGGGSSGSSSTVAGSGGSSAAGAAGTAGGGAGGAAGGTAAGAGGTTAGAGGTAGAATAGTGGTGGTAGAATAGAGGTGGAAAGAGGAACTDETTGVIGDGEAGAGGASDSVTTAIVLIDDVVVTSSDNTTVLAQWQFPDATTIADTSTARPGDKWSRTPYSSIGDTQTPSDTFLACDGNPAAGSIKNIIPFSADNQYYQISVLSAQHDYSSAKVTAKVKLVSGGRPVSNCQAGALMYAVDGDDFTSTPLPAFTTLVEGQWVDIALTIPATGFAKVDELAVEITTYSCN
jgi:hypothetical protein